MDFVIWALAFELYLSFASLRHFAGLHGSQETNGKPTKRIVCTLTSESAADGRLTYEKELLNFRKDSHFYKTNHFWLPRVSPPAPMARKNKWQTDETNRVYSQGQVCRRQSPYVRKRVVELLENKSFLQNESSRLPCYCRPCNFCEMGYSRALRLNAGEYEAIPPIKLVV
jgi:hypothetical protein